ncbi:SEL1-like repeat protein [Pelistega indica]|uniref:SEL1-like repeat protein n=1 Tax=Pelistega indica TaxID=1414851 RepID=UPI000423E1BB|nr:SEL1-like repeat protein [Pelistega indica]
MLKKSLITTLLGGLLLSSPLSYANQAGNDNHETKRRATITDFPRVKALAEKGNAGAQNNLGLMYQTGDQVKQDGKLAVQWLEKASKNLTRGEI